MEHERLKQARTREREREWEGERGRESCRGQKSDAEKGVRVETRYWRGKIEWWGKGESKG